MKRIVSVFLIMVLCICCFVGCSKEIADDQQNVELVWVFPQEQQEDMPIVQDAFNEYLKDKLPNTTVRFDIINWGNYDERISMMSSANEKFDICFSSPTWLNKYYPAVMNGAYSELDELIEKDAPKLKQSIPQFMWDAAKINGKIYGVPNYQLAFTNWSMSIRKDLADKYDLKKYNVEPGKNLVTLKQMEPFLEQIVKNEKDVIPFKYEFVPYPDGVEDLAIVPLFAKEVEGKVKVINPYAGNKLSEEFQLYREWYEKGYFRKDLITTTDDTAEMKNNKYAVVSGVTRPGALEELNKRQGMEYVEIDILKPRLNSQKLLTAITTINEVSKNKSRAIKLLELINTDKTLFNILSYGIENTHYQKVGANTVKVLPDSKYKPGTPWLFGNQFNAFLIEGQKEDTWTKTMELNENSEKSPIIGLSLNIDEVKLELTQVNNVISQYKMIWAMDDIDKLILERNTKLKEAGIDKVIEVVQKQIDDFKK